jgi:beta-glucosidase-like glycosyl hydrolase
MPPDVPTAFNAVKNAVENGEISRENIDDSVYRILKLKS